MKARIQIQMVDANGRYRANVDAVVEVPRDVSEELAVRRLKRALEAQGKLLQFEITP